MSNRVRVLRLIEYVGTPEWVNKCIEGRAVKGRRVISGDNFIQEGIIGEVPEVLPSPDPLMLTTNEFSILEQLATPVNELRPAYVIEAVASIVKRIKGESVGCSTESGCFYPPGFYCDFCGFPNSAGVLTIHPACPIHGLQRSRA